MKDMKYFVSHAIYAVEVEDADGCFRHWDTVKGDDRLAEYCKKIEDAGMFVSDVDYCMRQDDEWCKKVLNLANYNWTKNFEWCMKMKFKNFGDLIIWIIDNKRA